jgi:lipopolysaccharide biosynthesis glycosyltransferase
MVILTTCGSNYLPKAVTLAKSVKQHIIGAKFYLCLLEKEASSVLGINWPAEEIFLAKEIGYPNFEKFIFIHTIVEASTAIKAQLFKYLLQKYPNEDKFVYLDPDIVVYSDFTELRAELEKHSIILCPHLLEPGNIDMEVSSLQHGAYNLGFLGVSRSRETEKFLNWWAERLFWYCYEDIPNGIFTDQKWIDLAPCFFYVHIFKHRGYDFAPWSLMNSNFQKNGNDYIVNGDPLRFIHYSGYDSGTVRWAIEKWLSNKENNPFVDLYHDYERALMENGQNQWGKTPWSYDYYVSGEKISKPVRDIFRKNRELQLGVENPYNYGNKYFEQQNNQLLKRK